MITHTSSISTSTVTKCGTTSASTVLCENVTSLTTRRIQELLKEAQLNPENWITSVILTSDKNTWIPGDLYKTTMEFYMDTRYNERVEECNYIVEEYEHVMFLGWKLSSSIEDDKLNLSMCFLHGDKVVHHWRDLFSYEWKVNVHNMMSDTDDAFAKIDSLS